MLAKYLSECVGASFLDVHGLSWVTCWVPDRPALLPVLATDVVFLAPVHEWNTGARKVNPSKATVHWLAVLFHVCGLSGFGGIEGFCVDVVVVHDGLSSKSPEGRELVGQGLCFGRENVVGDLGVLGNQVSRSVELFGHRGP